MVNTYVFALELDFVAFLWLVELQKIIFKANPETPSENLRFSISFQHDWFSIPAIFHFILEGARLMVLDGALWYL